MQVSQRSHLRHTNLQQIRLEDEDKENARYGLNHTLHFMRIVNKYEQIPLSLLERN